jgi:ElaB/YqjD/DUF883 family membrane-anchored ribosome-binding protein
MKMGMMQDFQKADEERRREVKHLQDEVATIRSEAANMLKELAKEDTRRASEVTNNMRSAVATIRSEVGTIRSDAADMLKDLAKEDDERRSEVTNFMRSEVGNIRSEVADMLKDLAKEDTRRASEVTSNMRSAVATIRSDVAAIHEMVWGKAPAKKAGAPPKVAPTPKVAPPVGALRDRVFAYLADHPDGTRLAEMETEFGVSRIEMARVVRALMDNNKVEKRELLYFAI